MISINQVGNQLESALRPGSSTPQRMLVALLLIVLASLGRFCEFRRPIARQFGFVVLMSTLRTIT